MPSLIRQYQAANFNIRGYVQQSQVQTGRTAKEFLVMLRETESYQLQLGMLRQLSFQQHQVYSGANNANIC